MVISNKVKAIELKKLGQCGDIGIEQIEQYGFI